MKWRWTESGNGYLECKAASKQLRYAALADARVIQFAHPVDGPEMQEGALKEEGSQRKPIPPKIKVTEIGRAIQLLPNYIPFRSFDLEDPIQKHLVWQMKNTLDHLSMIALKQGSANIITSATILRSVIQGAKWTGIEALCSVASGYCSRAETYDKTHYVGIGGVRFLRAVERHPKFLPWEKYLREGDELFLGERGSTNNIRWIAFTDMSLLKNEAVVFGHQGLLLKEVQAPNLRFSNGVMAWYGILAFVGQNVLHIPERKRRWA